MVQLSTVRLMLTIIIFNGWYTKHVDCSSVFVQAKIQEEVYIKTLCGFGGASRLPKVLKILQSLYGLKQALKAFFDKLKAGLSQCNFIQSEIDKCPFMKGDLV